jgi:hypothetical protein
MDLNSLTDAELNDYAELLLDRIINGPSCNQMIDLLVKVETLIYERGL